jgi:hypothetical protein
MRYSEFIEHVRATGWEFDFLAVNTFLRNGSVGRKISDRLARLPGVRDYVPHNVYAVLKLK